MLAQIDPDLTEQLSLLIGLTSFSQLLATHLLAHHTPAKQAFCFCLENGVGLLIRDACLLIND